VAPHEAQTITIHDPYSIDALPPPPMPITREERFKNTPRRYWHQGWYQKGIPMQPRPKRPKSYDSNDLNDDEKSEGEYNTPSKNEEKRSSSLEDYEFVEGWN